MEKPVWKGSWLRFPLTLRNRTSRSVLMCRWTEGIFVGNVRANTYSLRKPANWDPVAPSSADWIIVPPGGNKQLSVPYIPDPRANGVVELCAAIQTPRLERFATNSIEDEATRLKVQKILDCGEAVLIPARIKSENTIRFDFGM